MLSLGWVVFKYKIMQVNVNLYFIYSRLTRFVHQIIYKIFIRSCCIIFLFYLKYQFILRIINIISKTLFTESLFICHWHIRIRLCRYLITITYFNSWFPTPITYYKTYCHVYIILLSEIIVMNTFKCIIKYNTRILPTLNP